MGVEIRLNIRVYGWRTDPEFHLDIAAQGATMSVVNLSECGVCFPATFTRILIYWAHLLHTSRRTAAIIVPA